MFYCAVQLYEFRYRRRSQRIANTKQKSKFRTEPLLVSHLTRLPVVSRQARRKKPFFSTPIQNHRN